MQVKKSTCCHNQNNLSTNQLEENILLSNRRWFVLIAIGTGTFMSALDISVVNTILPILQRDLKSNIPTIEWIIIVYLLLVSALLPIFGRLGDIHGHKQIYLWGFVIFIGSSLLCALANNVYMLILFRGFQAIGAAMLSSNSPAILTKIFPSTQRGKALGLQATMTYLGLTVGPPLGGLLTDIYSWRAVFLINIPVGFVAIVLSVFFITKDRNLNIAEGFDFKGAFLFTVGLMVLLICLNQGHNWGWTSPLIFVLLIISLSLFVGFLYHENRTRYPLLDLTLFNNRIFSSSVISAVLNYICVNSSIFLLPFFLIQGLEMNPSKAGLYLSVQPIIMAIAAPISGSLSDRYGTKIPTFTGMTTLAFALFLLSKIGPESSTFYILLSLSILGLGTGIFISPNNSALMGSAPLNRQGIAAGVLATSRNIGMLLGIGLAGAIFTTVIDTTGSNPNLHLLDAIKYSYLAAMCVAIFGIIVTLVREDTNR